MIKNTLWALLFTFLALITLVSLSFAEDKRVPIIVNGDKVEFLSEGKRVLAEGKVVIEYQDAKLTCDKVTVSNETKEAIAEGNVVLTFPKVDDQGKEVLTIIKGPKATYNFETKQGTLVDSNFESIPYYGKSAQTQKISDSELKIKEGYFTTCNLDKPHYRLRAKQVLIYPNDKIIAKNVTFMAGEVPVMYIPQYVQRLDDKRPKVTVTPGKNKTWGLFLLTAWRYYFIEDQQGRILLDYREKKDFASGFTHKYKLGEFGKGLLKTYYMHERNIQTKHLWEQDRKTWERERFKVQWYHKAEIDDQTTAMLEYHKFKDPDFLKEYFRREYDAANEPPTYFLFSHVGSLLSFSLKSEERVNRFYAASTERLPEAKIDTAQQRIFGSPIYLSDTVTLSNLRKRFPGSAESQIDAKRADNYSQFSVPTRLFFINVNPYTNVRETYFSRDAIGDSNVIRGVSYSGVDFNTTFFRLFDVTGKPLGVKINKLRHVVNPSITYSYIHEPTVPASNLMSFDEIDSITRENKATLSLENKLQTKRNNASYELARFITSTDYLFNKDPGGRFDAITYDLELTLVEWMRIETDANFDLRTRHFTSVNTDIAAHGENDKWSVGLGRRYTRKGTQQVELQTKYRVNPKWAFSVYERSYPRFSRLKEQEYVITRDLHCWEFEVSYNVTRNVGEEIWFILRLKAFPETGFEFNQGYHAPKAGSQSLTGGDY